MNKALRLTGLLLLALFFGRETAYAQYPAALNEVPFKEKKRGLNYTYATARLSTRGSIGGAGLPYTFNVSGIPAGAVVEKAMMWWTASSNTKDSGFTVTHSSSTYTRDAHLLGAGPDKCWSYAYTTNFRGEVSDIFTENGSYTIDIALGSGPVDGFGLIILYSDSTADYVGSMTINDGIVVATSATPVNHTMSVEVPCVSTTRSEQIFLIGDVQNVGTSISNGTRSRAITWNWFNFDTLRTSLTAGTNTKNFSVTAAGDCYSVVGTAIYYQYPVDTSYKTSITKTRQVSCPSLTDGKVKLTVATSGPYTIDWYTTPPQTGDSAVNLAPGIYTFRLTDTCGNRYYDTVLIPKFRPVITKSKPGVYLCTPDTNILTASAGTSYQWLKNNIIIPSASGITYAVTSTGSYRVIVTNGLCTDTSDATVFGTAPAIVYVDSSVAVSGTGLSWASPFKTVREALNFANYNSSVCALQVWVKKGTYYPTADGNRDSSFRIVRNNIKLYGGFAGGETLLGARSVTANPTILSADLGVANDSADNCYHVMTIQGSPSLQIDTNTVVDGFTITRGNAQTLSAFIFNGATYNRSNGGGINLWGAGSGNNCSPLIANCTFTRNTSNFGGGVYNAGYSAGNCSPILRNDIFTFNKAGNLGGGLLNNGQSSGQSSPLVDNCTFSYNNASGGGGMACQAASSGTSAAIISNSIFNNNKSTVDGGGFYNSYGKPVISNCRFYQNESASAGGGYFQQGGKAAFNNNIFEQNAATIGGAIRIYTGDPSIMITRNVFYRNTSSINDAGAISLVCANGNDTVINNLFVQNKAFGSGPNGGGAMVQEGGTSSYIVSNTFYADSSAGSGGTVHFKDGGSNRFMHNNIFYKSYNGSSASDYNTASGATVTESNNLFSSVNPKFIKESNPVGADGIWLTNDDGLDLSPCSPAINTGTTAPAEDIRNRVRVGLPDIGAYEEQGKPLPTAPLAPSPVNYCQNATATGLLATRSSASDTLKWYNSTLTLLSGIPTPATTDTGTFTYYVSQTDSSGCESTKTTINVVISITPDTPVAATLITYCQGVSAAPLSATLAPGSDTLKWYNSAMSLLPGAPTPSTAATGTFTYYVSQKTGQDCEGPKKMITIQVNPTPAAPLATTPVTYCQGVTATALTATLAAGSDTLKWYNSAMTALSGAPVPSTAATGTFTYYVSQKTGLACEGPKTTITVQVNPTPDTPAATTSFTYCQGVAATALTATLAAGSDTLKWYNSAMTALPGAPTPPTTTTGTFTYYVSQKTGLACEGPKTTITVHINATPDTPAAATLITYCQGVSAAALNATLAAGSDTLKWYNSTMTLLPGAPTPSTATPGTYTWYVSQKTGLACEGPKTTIKVQVNPTPDTPAATTLITYCQGVSASVLSATLSAGSDTLKWYNSAMTALPGAPTPATTTAGTFTWYVSQKTGLACEGPKTTISVIIKPTPPAPVATTPVVYCEGAAASALTATLAAGSDTLKWYNSSMTALSGAPTPATTTAGTYTWYVSQKTGLACEGPKTTITVQVNPTPALPVTTTPVTYCQNATSVALTATSASASDTLRWYNSVPALLSGAPTPSTATAGTFTFYVSQKNGFSCESAKKAITIQINPTPVAPPSASPVTYCQDDVAVALTATKASSTDTLKWYSASTALLGAAPVPSTVSPGTTIYYVSAKTTLGCEGPKTTINVVVNPRPLPPVVVTPIDICVGVAPAALTATGTNLKWYTAATGGTGSATLKPVVSTVGTNTYYVTQTNTFSCESLRESLKVNVRPSPTVTVAPVGMPAFVFCVGDSIAIKATSATAISYQWQINTTPIPGSVTDTLHIDTTSTYSVIVKDFYGCADTESVLVMKNPLPKPKLSPVDVTICKGVSIILYASPATTGYKYEWFKDGSPMGVDTSKDRITVDSTGFYMVRMKDIYTCTVNTNGASVSQYPEMVKPAIVMSGSVLKVATTYASYQWYRNGSLIAGATGKSYTMSFDGDYYVVVYDVNGCQGTSAVVTSKVLGINSAQAQSSISVYPNPTQGKVIIDAGATVNVIVTDITGRELLRKQQTTEIDLEPFADGIYMLRIFDKDGQLLSNERINKQTK